MNTYTKLKFHHERHVFKRGQHKGDAPAGKRWRTYVRVIRGNDDTMRVRMYGTDLLTAYPDGRVEIDTGGWYDRPTTRLRLNEAFGFMPFRAYIGSRKVFGMSQPVLYVAGKSVLYYDGISLDGEGNITSKLVPFERRRVNKEESKELRDDMEACGFKDVFNVLWASCTPDDAMQMSNQRAIVTNEYHSNHWVKVIANYTWERSYRYGQFGYIKRDSHAVWDALMQHLRKELYEVVRTDVTLL